MKPPLPLRVGRYDIVDRLGAGGMGVVYLATDPLLRRTVAIKVLPGGDDELRERFGREARSAASLRHNNVVTIYDVGEDGGQPFIAMEFLDGESMAEMIHRRAPLTVGRRLQLIIELCAGLGHAHRSGIIHRDVKPGNLMITTEGSLKILDFGLARLTASASQTGLTRAGSVMGTPHYMSPEQVQGEPVDQRSDIFSVGLVLYEVLTYQKAYSGESPHVVLHNILHKTPAPIRSLVPSIDSELEEIVGKGLEKMPSRRYQDLSALASDLANVRARLMSELDGSTFVNERQDGIVTPEFESGSAQAPSPIPRNARNLDALAQRRAAQVDQHVAAAARHFAEKSYEAAIAECENAIMFNSQEARALELLDRAHHALEDVQVGRWLEEARALLSVGELTAAEALIGQSLKLRADSDDVQTLQRELKEMRRERELAAERLRATRSAIERARAHLGDGAFDAALRSASEALAYDGSNAEALSLKEQVLAAIAQRRREREHDQSARELVQLARVRADSGDVQGALVQLRGFSPPHQIVTEAIAAVESQLHQQQRLEAEAAIAKSRGQFAAGEAQAAITLLESFRPRPLVAGALRELQLELSRRVQQETDQRQEPAVEATSPEQAEAPRRKQLNPAVRRWPVVAMVAVAGVVLALSVWGLSRSREGISTQSPATASPVDYEAVVEGAWDQYLKGDESGALTTAMLVLSVPEWRRSQRAVSLLTLIREDAERRASSARSEPETAKPSGSVLHPTARLAEALRLSDSGDYGRAVSLYHAILTDDPGNLAATRGLEIVTRAQRQQANQVTQHLEDAQRHSVVGEYDAAITAYEAVLRIAPKDVRAIDGLAQTRKAQSAEAAALGGLRKKPGS